MTPRTSLELYLLTLIHRGFGTPYALKSRADLSLGSSVPALARLEQDGLIRGSEIQSRRSRRFTVTGKGLRTLKAEWRSHLDIESSDLDSILRISYLACVLGSPRQGSFYLRRSSKRIATLAKATEAKADRFGAIPKQADNELLRLLRTRIEARRLAASAKELAAFARELDKDRSEPGASKKVDDEHSSS